MNFRYLILLFWAILPSVTYSQILIITADRYNDALKPYIEWKSQKGLWVEVAKMSDIGSSAQDVKSYVADFYKSHNNRYLLLVGDANDVPTHISYGITNPNEYSAYSDAEYGYINNSDYPPAVIVGRFSGESVEDIATQVERVIYYERDINENDSWLSNAVGIADTYSYETGDNGETDYKHISNLNSNIENSGYTAYFTNAKRDLISLINNGCGLINYIGHGYPDSWVTTGFSVSDAESLTNANKLPVIIASGCQNGHFRLSTCLAESLLRGRDAQGRAVGAIGMMAFTTQIYWNPPMLGQDEFARILTADSVGFVKSFGEVINAAYKRVIDVYKGSGYDVACQWALFGDPSLILRTKSPLIMNISHKSSVEQNDKILEVNCDTDNATATLWLEGKIIDSKIVDKGYASLSLSNLEVGKDIKLTITADNRVSYQTDIEITESSGIIERNESLKYTIFTCRESGMITIIGNDETVSAEIFDNSGKLLSIKEMKTNTPSALCYGKGVYFIHILNNGSLHKVILK